MNLNSKTTTYITLIDIAIVVLIGLIIVVTNNPLAILGLFFIQDMPVFQELSGANDRDEYDEDVGCEEMAPVTAPGDDYADTKAGFTAKV